MNRLYYGDNLDILRNEEHIPRASVDLIYLDPPFNSKANYNVLFKEHTGKLSAAQITAFEDTWKWGLESEAAYNEIVTNGPKKIADLMQALRLFLGQSDMMAYVAMMAPRLLVMYDVLKPDGSLYLHCDTTASHYIKLILDAIFGPTRFQNEIVWKRTTAHNDPKRYGRIGDRLLFYAKGKPETFNHVGGKYSKEQLNRYKYTDEDGNHFRAENLTAPHYSATRTVLWRGVHPGKNRQWRFSTTELDRLWDEGRILTQKDGRPRKDGLIEYPDTEGPALQDIWTDISLSPTAAERLGYPTQKPEKLLERIIRVSSNEGDVVLDPFCGCGTTVAVAEQWKRKWIGIDITHLAISLMRHRLRKTMGRHLTPYEVVGEPKDFESAKALALLDRYQFQYWAAGVVDAHPVRDKKDRKKKGADAGIDGFIRFFDDKSGQAKTVIVQVKSGGVSVKDIRELIGVVKREKAAIGVFITLEPTSKPMRDEAITEGFYKSPLTGKNYQKIQILTVEELLSGKRADYPLQSPDTFTAAKMKGTKQEQIQLI